MPAFIALIAVLAWNGLRGFRGNSTICSTGRRFVSPRVFIAGWAAFSAWFIPHFCLYRLRERQPRD